MLFLLHAVFNGGLIFESENPIVPIKSTPLQRHVSELPDNAGRVSTASAEKNLEYATYMAAFLEEHGSLEDGDRPNCVRELIRLLRFYDTNAIPIRDDTVDRVIAKGVYLSTSFFNHSCVPNCVATFEGDSLTIRTTCLVPENTELCISYIDNALPRTTRQAQLQLNWRFDCSCDRCTSKVALENEALVHGMYCPLQGCRGRLERDSADVDSAFNQRPNALSVSSVPYVDQSFIPSQVGFTGDRAGYEYREGRHGVGYYQGEDEYGEAIVERGDALGPHKCLSCNRVGVDVYMQQALILTAERHKFFYTHKQPCMDARIAAFQTAEQLRQVKTSCTLYRILHV